MSLFTKKLQGNQPVILSYGEAPFDLSEVDLGSVNSDAGYHYSGSSGVPAFCR